jgi:hypothetical protein
MCSPLKLGKDGRILEGLVTTLGATGEVHVAPMGSIVDNAFERLIFRPYPSSTTLANLKRSRQGVLHVTDDVACIARAAVNQLDPIPPHRPAKRVAGVILTDACRWYAFQIDSIDERATPAILQARVVDRGTQREFFGFNRAKHAVLEAAIVASRIGILPAEKITTALAELRILVEKTGAAEEHAAFDFLCSYVADTIGPAEVLSGST